MGSLRKRSKTGFYHAVPKAYGEQNLFEDDDDRRHFIDLLIETRSSHDQHYHAWCLMRNHVHLIVFDPSFHIGDAMRDVLSSYATYHHAKHGTRDAAFRDRYWSEPINDEAYLLTAMNYIHFNPQAAGICPAGDYRWSSFRAFARGLRDCPLSEPGLLLDMLGGARRFLEFSRRRPTARAFPKSTLYGHLDGDEVRVIAAAVLGCSPAELSDVPSWNETARGNAVRLLRTHGFTIRQIAEITEYSHRRIDAILRGKVAANH